MTTDDPSVAASGDSLRIVRRLAAPPERVWRAWTDPDELASWYWPDSFDTAVEIDLRVGGRYRIASATAGIAVSGTYVTVDPPSRLVQTWRWDGEDVDSLVTTELSAAGADGAMTELVVTHERLTGHDERRQHAQGWNDCLDRLGTYL